LEFINFLVHCVCLDERVKIGNIGCFRTLRSPNDSMTGLMESLLGILGFGQRDLDVEDPATGLTLRQRNYVRSTWALVVPNIKQVGLDLMTT